MLRKNKKAVSALVATVLLILVTVAAVGIIWAAVMPMITRALELNQACLNARLNIDTTRGYTCYDAEKKQANVMVTRGAEDFELTGMQIGLVSTQGETKNIDTRQAWVPKDRSQIKILIIENGSTIGGWDTRLTSLGYSVTVDDSITTKAEIDAINPDVVACFKYVWSCGKTSLYTELYNANYALFSEGNDNRNWLLPIDSSEGTSVNTLEIYPDKETNNFISKGWSSATGSGTDSRQGVTGVNQHAQVVAIDTTNNFFEAIYLEEEGKGRWFNYQPSHLAPDKIITNAIDYLTREETVKVYQKPGLEIYLPAINEGVSYTVDLNALGIVGDITEATAAPVVKIGDSEKVCAVTSTMQVPKCA